MSRPLLTLDNPVLPPGADALAAYDPTDGLMRIVRRSAPNRVTVQRVFPSSAGAYNLGPEEIFTAEAFLEAGQHLTVCIAREPSWRATHLLMHEGNVIAVRLDGDRLRSFCALQLQPDPEGQPTPPDPVSRYSVEALLEGVQEDGPQLVPIRWGNPLRAFALAEQHGA